MFMLDFENRSRHSESHEDEHVTIVTFCCQMVELDYLTQIKPRTLRDVNLCEDGREKNVLAYWFYLNLYEVLNR